MSYTIASFKARCAKIGVPDQAVQQFAAMAGGALICTTHGKSAASRSLIASFIHTERLADCGLRATYELRRDRNGFSIVRYVGLIETETVATFPRAANRLDLPE